MITFFRNGILIVTTMILLNACSTTGKSKLSEPFNSLMFENIEIAPLDKALTFARVLVNNERHIIVVKKFLNGQVEGIDLTLAMNSDVDDPISAYSELGYKGLVKLANDSLAEYSITVNVDQLIMPVDLQEKHIAAGLNYLAHAGETGIASGPFLFSKHVTPTGSNENVAIKKGLLDYEVELAAVTLGPVREGKLSNEYGLILTNDFTNRAKLLRNIDVNDVTSGKGFAVGKSSKGFLPIGNLFVIPRSPKEFAQNLTMKLFVNDNLHQQGTTDLMIWGFEKIVAEAWAKKDITWDYKGEPIKLMGEEPFIKARTLIMSGTPEGVIFQGIPFTTKLAGIFSWTIGGWDSSVPQNVIEAYINNSEESRMYLQPSDTVSIHVNNLGTLNNKIIP
jgi:2,4-diketo-3-deoxy-L-fuconate hydrolase